MTLSQKPAPPLSEALFSDSFIVSTYNPLDTYFSSDRITPSTIRRFNSATIRCYECLIEKRVFHHAYVAFSIERFYESAGLRAWALHEHGTVDIDYSLAFGEGVTNAIKLANKLMAAASEQAYSTMFVKQPDDYQHDTLAALVDIVYNALGHISKGFEGPSDPFWSLAIKVMHDGFHSIGAEPDGMTPFQQRLTLKLARKLNDNMNGFYPAICRVLLAAVGPYDQKALQPNMTAFNILRNVMYRELKRFPDLADGKPDKVGDYLPNNLAYDVDNVALTHTYFGGSQVTTVLNALEVDDIDLLDKKHHRSLTEDELKDAAREIF